MTALKFATLVALSLAIGCGTVGTCGCEDGCEADRTCGTSTVAPPSCPDDPADGDVDGACGVWVSTSLGDDANPGTQEAPVRTLQRGVDLAPGGHVYACAELYYEPVAIPAGTSLHGAFSCLKGAWARGDTRATLITAADVIPLRLTEGVGTSLVTDLDVRAGNAAGRGQSSIAAWADTGAKVELRRVELRAGNGSDGGDGLPGGTVPAMGGTAGYPGVGACTFAVGTGGEAPATSCDDGLSTGGEGGDGAMAFAQPGGDGSPDYGGGHGGNGEDLSPTCMPGSDGVAGVSGLDGEGAESGGSLGAEGYVGPAGAPGTAGTRAQGGGGGGASFGNNGCGVAPHGGAGGGSGGAGGCGGKPGAGGQGGGASIALASRSSNVRLVDARLVAAGGGRGGNGGSAQVGGLGGLPGLGGASYPGQPPVHSGCSGGFGGKGGNGGNGGGGVGGPSAAIAHLFGAAPDQKGVELVVGAAGGGGLGGNPAESAGAGAAGTAAKVLEL